MRNLVHVALLAAVTLGPEWAEAATSRTLEIDLQSTSDTFLPFVEIPVTIMFKNTGEQDIWIRRRPTEKRFDASEFQLICRDTNRHIASLVMYSQGHTTPPLAAFVRIPAGEHVSVTFDLLTMFYPDTTIYGGEILDKIADYQLRYIYQCRGPLPKAIQVETPQGPIWSGPYRFRLRRPTKAEINQALESLSDRRSTVRNRALQLLALVREERVTTTIVSLLTAEQQGMRRRAFEAALRWPDNEPIASELLRLLQEEPSERFRNLAAVCIGELRIREAIPALEKAALDKRYPNVAIVATRLLLSDFASTQSLPVLRKAVPQLMANKPEYVRRSYNRWLNKLERKAKASSPDN